MEDDVFRGIGVEIDLPGDDSFLKVKETLTRMGVSSKKDRKLYQSCHILHKRGRYAIVHFKELFMLDGKTSDFSDDDKGRRNTIVNLLEEWGLIAAVSQLRVEDPVAPISQIKILSFREKSDWELVTKYTIGKRT